MSTGREEGERKVEEAPLFPGERQDSPFREDAEHWVAVYQELVVRAGELAATANGSHGALQKAQQRYRRRLAFWLQRLDEMKSSGV